jgi:hypothetical protein
MTASRIADAPRPLRIFYFASERHNFAAGAGLEGKYLLQTRPDHQARW